MIDLLIVDDSEVARKLLNYIFSTDPQIRVIGAVKSGEEALKFISHRKPDVITMDVEMPNMDGFEVTRQIMGSNPIPIVIITATYSSSMVDKAFSAVDAGALAILEKPSGINHPDFANMAAEILGVKPSLEIVDQRPYDLAYNVLNCTNAYEELGWIAGTSLQEGLTKSLRSDSLIS